jgi:hypothetical protein
MCVPNEDVHALAVGEEIGRAISAREEQILLRKCAEVTVVLPGMRSDFGETVRQFMKSTPFLDKRLPLSYFAMQS